MSPQPLSEILDLARWAPSGDNTQPWRFQVLADDRLIVHGFDTRSHCVYDIDGRPSQMSIGALLENIAIAATTKGMRASVARQTGSPEERPRFDVTLERDARVVPDRLASVIRSRAVQRRPMSTRPLTADEKRALESILPSGYTVSWFEGWDNRWRFARMLFRNARIRLTIPEAYEVHRSVIQWHATFSQDRIPDQALGLSSLSLGMMRPVMVSWKRVQFFNRFLAGTWSPRIELDLIPGLACAAHFVISAPASPQTIDDYVAGGRAMQRFWLEAARLGLHAQPQTTPLVFAKYFRAGRRFSGVEPAWEDARRVTASLTAILQENGLDRAVFMGRIGAGAAPTARSTRLPLGELMYRPTGGEPSNV
jgi:nitroreductase